VRGEKQVNTVNQKFLQNLVTILAVLALSACNSDKGERATAFEYKSMDTTVASRGVAVPVTYVQPVVAAGESFPLVVMLHGHGGSRNEAGGYTSVAERLAARGIASIRMDFPGCGDSTESFANNNLGNMLQDIQASREFALTQGQVDKSRLGLLGYSMGGRLALLHAAAFGDYDAVVTWTPDALNGPGGMIDFVGGQAAYDELKARAGRESFAPFTTRWGQEQKLGLQFFTDLEESRALDAAGKIEAPLLVLYGDLDDVVLPSVSEGLIAAATMSPEVLRHVVKGADHGLGLYNNEPALTEETVKTTVDFLRQRL
jgi:dienelactone hydrolase